MEGFRCKFCVECCILVCVVLLLSRKGKRSNLQDHRTAFSFLGLDNVSDLEYIVGSGEV